MQITASANKDISVNRRIDINEGTMQTKPAQMRQSEQNKCRPELARTMDKKIFADGSICVDRETKHLETSINETSKIDKRINANED